MTNPGLLDFFTLEAGEYIEQLDGLIAAAGDEAPDIESLIRQARALRGASTMARLTTLAELAGGVERVARSMKEGLVMWEPGLRGVVIAAIDDLKLLLRSVRTWGTAEDQRAQARIAELGRWAPGGKRAPSTTPAAAGGTIFFANGASDIAKAIDAYLARPDDRLALTDVLRHARTLRGVAAIKEVPPLGEIVEAVEHAARPLELTADPPTPAQVGVLTSASTILRDAAQSLGIGQLPQVDPEALRRFTASAGALAELSAADQIVPIESLFHDDAGPHLLSGSPTPPTTPAQRFRLEVVSQAEHLRAVIADARRSTDAAGRERAAGSMRSALRALRSAAESFGENGVSGFVDQMFAGAGHLEPAALAAVDEAAAMLARPDTDPAEVARRIDELSGAAAAAAAAPRAAPAARAAPPVRPAPTAAPGSAIPARGGRGLTPSGRPLDAVLDQSLARLGALDESPFSEPAPIPIDALLYRGPSALTRAREIRDALQAGAGAQDQELLAELYDLLDLAAAE